MLDTLNQMLTDQFGPFGPLMAMGGLGLLLIVGTIPFMLKQDEDPLTKLKKQRDMNHRTRRNTPLSN